MSRRLLAAGLVGFFAAAVGQAGEISAGTPVEVAIDADPGIAGIQTTRAIPPGDPFTIDIRFANISDLRAFNFEAVYDQTRMSAPTVSAGSDLDRNPNANQSFLASTGRTWSCSPPAPSGDTDASPTVGVAFISCFSSGAPSGPSAGSGGSVVATVEFDALASGTSALTLQNVNTFTAGGIETGSCNPAVIVSATCTGASINVISGAVGGIAELPELASQRSAVQDRGGGSRAYVLIAGAGAVLLLLLGLAAVRMKKGFTRS